MVQKRPFNGDDTNQFTSKQPRPLVTNSRIVSAMEFPYEDVVQSPIASGDNSAKSKVGCHKQLDVAYSVSPFTEDMTGRAPGSFSRYFWTTGGASEEDINSEAPSHFLSSPDYYNFERPPQTYIHPGEVYTYLLNRPPRKLVPVGPDFQADVPEYVGHGGQMTCNGTELLHEVYSQAIESVKVDHSNCESQLTGNIVIPKPDLQSPVENGEIGVGRMNCLCEDLGSIRCVRKHILEAREKLKSELGPETFAQLGFCNMGEIVAEKWSEQEEQLFHDIVFCNPATSGKNFWDNISTVFRSRTKEEIVSYYFNVFMLRKRAEQNRFHPMNIDSDNDEWQGPEDSTDNEAEIVEDDDSDVELPVNLDRDESFNKHTHVYNKDASQSSPSNDYTAECCGRNMNASQICPAAKEIGERDIHDGSFTANGAEITLTADKSDNCKQWGGHFGMNGTSSHEFVLDECSAKEWGEGFLTHPRKDVDLLPTCSMIEEVFGAGAWARDNRELS